MNLAEAVDTWYIALNYSLIGLISSSAIDSPLPNYLPEAALHYMGIVLKWLQDGPRYYGSQIVIRVRAKTSQLWEHKFRSTTMYLSI